MFIFLHLENSPLFCGNFCSQVWRYKVNKAHTPKLKYFFVCESLAGIYISLFNIVVGFWWGLLWHSIITYHAKYFYFFAQKRRMSSSSLNCNYVFCLKVVKSSKTENEPRCIISLILSPLLRLKQVYTHNDTWLSKQICKEPPDRHLAKCAILVSI